MSIIKRLYVVDNKSLSKDNDKYFIDSRESLNKFKKGRAFINTSTNRLNVIQFLFILFILPSLDKTTPWLSNSVSSSIFFT